MLRQRTEELENKNMQKLAGKAGRNKVNYVTSVIYKTRSRFTKIYLPR